MDRERISRPSKVISWNYAISTIMAGFTLFVAAVLIVFLFGNTFVEGLVFVMAGSWIANSAKDIRRAMDELEASSEHVGNND